MKYLRVTEKWENKEIELRIIARKQFKEYIKRLDLSWEKNVKVFHKILNSLVKYKVKNSVAAGVTKDSTVLMDEKKTKIIKEYYENYTQATAIRSK